MRDKLKILEPEALIAQRLKRAESIINKLHRMTSMNLARMQDIGGLRAIVSNLNMVEKLKENGLVA